MREFELTAKTTFTFGSLNFSVVDLKGFFFNYSCFIIKTSSSGAAGLTS